MSLSLKQKISCNLYNLQGWQTKRKIVVIESDDWGGIRMPSKDVYEKLKKNGIRVDQCPFNSYDSLASEDDLSALFDVLMQFRNKNNCKPVITANSIVANPDFEKIRASGFREYYYEPFIETLKRYPNHTNSFQLWNQGMQEGIFFPQFHGREHLNIYRWMKGLQENLKETHLAFDSGLFGISTNITSEKRKSYMSGLDFDEIAELNNQKLILADGLNLFEKLFDYRSVSYIATNYTWHRNLEPELTHNGIKFLQGSRIQSEPRGNSFPHTRIHHHLGEVNNSGQHYLVRNCSFEPSIINGNNALDNCLEEISTAFRWSKPAIISSHRLNYIGSIVPENRSKNLKLLHELIKRILAKWPQVEFMTSVQLGDLIIKNNFHCNEQGN